MIGGTLLIALVVFGLSWLFGFGRPERLVKFIVWLIFGPLLLSLLYNEWAVFASNLPWPARVALLVAVPFIVLFALRTLLPNSSAIRTIIDFIWDLLTFALTFPLRVFWRSTRQIADRERNRIRLQRIRPTVGGRPPLRNLERGRRPN
jgi:hypothetical protein